MAARTPSRSSIAANSGDQSELSPALELAVVIQDLGGCCTFSRVPLPNIRDGGQLWATAKRLVFGSSTLEIISAGMARCFVKIVVGVGAIQVRKFLFLI